MAPLIGRTFNSSRRLPDSRRRRRIRRIRRIR
jgi:hypothetical protein